MPVAESGIGGEDGDWGEWLKRIALDHLEDSFRASAQPIGRDEVQDPSGEEAEQAVKEVLGFDPFLSDTSGAGTETLGRLKEFYPLDEAAAGYVAEVVGGIRNAGRM